MVERSALHQLVLGLKHDAKLRHDYAGPFIGNVKFLLSRFSENYFGFFFCNWEEIADNWRVKKRIIFFKSPDPIAPHLLCALTLTPYSAQNAAFRFSGLGDIKKPVAHSVYHGLFWG